MQVGVFHPGVQHSRQTALALQQLGRLAFLATGLFDHSHSAVRRALASVPASMASPVQAELDRYVFDPLDPALVTAHPFYELPERLAARLGFPSLACSLDTHLNAAFGRRVATRVQDNPVALWGYNASAWSAFTDPRSASCPKILDRTTSDGRCWNAQRARLSETQPEWFADGSPAYSARQIEQDDMEYHAADRIVCGSPFVAQSIRDHSPVEGLAAKLTVLPYCYDAHLFAGGTPAPNPAAAQPVRFLFAGQVAGRKGIAHVLEAFAQTAPAEASLTVVGGIGVPDHLLAPYQDRVRFTGSVPRQAMPGIMQAHHAFVFPSYNEGSALVLLEAMASGMAIIQTQAAGLGASADSGIVLAEPDTQGVAEAMRTLIADRDRLASMRAHARAEAGARDFSAYRANIARLLDDMGL